jgi:hypothetical protein
MKRILSGSLFFLLLAGCGGESEFQGECQRDTDCRSFQRCDTLNFRCVCASDEACAAGEFCNPSGSCQKIATCFSNADCREGTICDIQSGGCIPASSCTTDFHCDLGQICQEGACRIGCRDTSDCDLQKREVCIEGTCRANLCESNRYCEFGKVCEPSSHICQAPSEPYCTTGCSPTCEQCGDNVTIGPCGDPRHVCARIDAANTRCWVYCEKDEECPSGYQCVPTTVSWGPYCQTDLDCTDNPVPDDRVVNLCDGTGGGQTVGRCRLNKQPCRKDEDCYQFTTHCVANQCIFASHCRPPGGCP